MINHVLVPLDGSQLAERALPIARQVVRSNGQITLLTAIPNAAPPRDAAEPREGKEQVENLSSMHPMREYLDKIAHNLRLQGYETNIELAGGDPAEAIIRQAEELHPDMVIMCTHGRSGLRRVLFGSITLKVLEASAIPVLVVPNREREEVPEVDLAPEPGISPAT